MTRPVALRILALAAAVGIAAQALLLGNVLGINAPILSGLLLGAAWWLRPAGARIDELDRWLPLGAIVISVFIAVRADPILLGLDAVAGCLLLGASMAAISGEAVTRRSVARVVELGLLVLGWAGVGIVRVVGATKRGPADVVDPVGNRVPSWLGAILRGLLIAIPILVLFAGLFSAADAAFDRLMGSLFSWNLDLGELPFRFAIAFFVAWASAGLLAIAAGSIGIDMTRDDRPPAPPLPQSLGAAAAGLPTTDRLAGFGIGLRIGAIEAATILVAVDVLFAVFVVLQLAYLFGGLDTLAATGLPYAQYARSGFFELVWVAFLAGGLLATVHELSARRTSVLVGAGLVLAGLTAVVLASALLRLRIYQDAYGWTELRFFVLAAIVWLAIGIAITMVLLARDRMRWLLHGLAIAAVGVLVAINLAGPSKVIAEQNVARVLNPSLVPADGRSGLDVTYAVRLGDDAIPALVMALPALDLSDRAELTRRLRARAAALASPDMRGWPSWNLGRERAREALAQLSTP
jgi:hypothetical protein